MLTRDNHVLRVMSRCESNKSLSVSRTGKGLVTLGRFLCATSRLPRRQSDWLQLHNSELISPRETAESEERGG